MVNNNEIIYEKAAVKFAELGIKNVTMGEIASQCNISKKSLYEQFRSKEELVYHIVESQLTKYKKYINAGRKLLPDAVTEMNQFFNYVTRSLDIMTPLFLDSVRRYYPEAYTLLVDFSSNNLLPYLHQNIARGIDEHLYRDDINQEIACTWYYGQLKNLFLENSISSTDRYQLLSYTNTFFVNCIVNGQGQKRINTLA